jgi:hypothetical protein
MAASFEAKFLSHCLSDYFNLESSLETASSFYLDGFCNFYYKAFILSSIFLMTE